MRHIRQARLAVAGVIAITALNSLAPAAASSANISHSYQANQTIANGSLVSLETAQSNYVEPANTDNGAQLLGVAVASTDSLLAVDPGAGQVQVATTGTANVLASTLSGTIAVGDQVAVSPFNGIGMKALPGSHIIGLAQTALNSSTQGVTTRQVTAKSGKNTNIQIGYIRVNIAIGIDSSSNSLNSQNGLQRFAKSLTGHTVSTVRVVISLVILITAFLSLVILIYASIYSSIISIGRNPLAKYAVFRTLRSVLGVALLTAIVAALTIFLLLR